MILIYGLLFLLGLLTIIIFTLKKIKKGISIFEIIIATAYIFSIFLMIIGLNTHANQYYTAIDPVNDECYIPFGGKHIATLFFYFISFNASILLVWLKGNKLPPLAKVLSLSFFVIGVILNVFVLLQVSNHDTENISIYTDSSEHQLLFLFTPILSIIISIFLTISIIKKNIFLSNDKIYSSNFLNKLNQYLVQKGNLPFWSFIILVPLLLVITVILILFGQDSNSIIKVFTETTNWRFSQQIHPPILDHKGHYLCTVAVTGSPEIVKPIRFGKRNGKTIIVNRQLLIANAFEEMLQNYSPRLHRFIRCNYDKYGYNLSKKINTENMSNLTYILMKPLEYIFLFFLYLFCEKPEERINKQYHI
jgi:hypothetical protein